MSIFTNSPRSDGFGAQFQDILWAMLYTENSGNKFKFSEPASFEHNYDNDVNFTKKLIDYMGFKNYNPDGQVTKILKIQDTYPVVQRNLDFFLNSLSLKIYKNKFFSDKINPYDTNYKNIAVHVRRHNKEDNRIQGTNTPDEYYINIINNIRLKYSNCKFHIYSQGEPLKFSSYLADDVVLHLDEPILDTFNGLVFADILVTSASSFSYVAAMLTNGQVYYKTFWHTPSKNWIIC